jgi:hypothetical protein
MNFQEQQDFVGRHVTFLVHPSDNQYTGMIQQFVLLNGIQHILLNDGAAYHLFTLSNVYGLQFVDNRQDESVQEENDDDAGDRVIYIYDSDIGSDENDDTTQCESDHDAHDDFPDIPFIPARHSEPEPCQCGESRGHACQLGQNKQEEPEEPEEPEEQKESVQCSICLDVIDMQRNAVSTECGHQFHLSCLVRNMASPSQNRQNCPLCRVVMLNDYKICSDDETVQRMMQILLQNNQSIQREINMSERLRATLLQRMQAIDALRNRMVQHHEVVLRDALLMLDQNALASNLYTRIASVVASAANNDIRENYYDLHESLEDTIRTICFDFALLSLGAQPDHLQPRQQHMEHREHNYEVNNADADADADADAHADADADVNRVNEMERIIPIVID